MRQHALASEIKKAAGGKALGEFSLANHMFDTSDVVVAKALTPFLKGDDEYFVSDDEEAWKDDYLISFIDIIPTAGEVRFDDTDSGCSVHVKCFYGLILVRWTNSAGADSISAFDIPEL